MRVDCENNRYLSPINHCGVQRRAILLGNLFGEFLNLLPLRRGEGNKFGDGMGKTRCYLFEYFHFFGIFMA